jgi:penicillin-binding protein 1A
MPGSSGSALVVGVWMGNDDRTPMKRVTGGSLPAEIWQRFVSKATRLLPRLDELPPAAPSATTMRATLPIAHFARPIARINLTLGQGGSATRVPTPSIALLLA